MVSSDADCGIARTCQQNTHEHRSVQKLLETRAIRCGFSGV